jgi:hypothetical protein
VKLPAPGARRTQKSQALRWKVPSQPARQDAAALSLDVQRLAKPRSELQMQVGPPVRPRWAVAALQAAELAVPQAGQPRAMASAWLAEQLRAWEPM